MSETTKRAPLDEEAPISLLQTFLFLGCFVYQLHELIEFRSDDNLGATVTLLANLGVVGGQGVVFATTASGQTLGIHTVVVLQGLYHRRGAQTR